MFRSYAGRAFCSVCSFAFFFPSIIQLFYHPATGVSDDSIYAPYSCLSTESTLAMIWWWKTCAQPLSIAVTKFHFRTAGMYILVMKNLKNKSFEGCTENACRLPELHSRFIYFFFWPSSFAAFACDRNKIIIVVSLFQCHSLVGCRTQHLYAPSTRLP